jgi:hypothetical protein
MTVELKENIRNLRTKIRLKKDIPVAQKKVVTNAIQTLFNENKITTTHAALLAITELFCRYPSELWINTNKQMLHRFWEDVAPADTIKSTFTKTTKK